MKYIHLIYVHLYDRETIALVERFNDNHNYPCFKFNDTDTKGEYMSLMYNSTCYSTVLRAFNTEYRKVHNLKPIITNGSYTRESKRSARKAKSIS